MANFLGSLILSATYNAGMSREDTPEADRVPFFVYVDEAYRYTTQSIPETLQSLRKFKVFMTLASQYLTQYRKDIQDAITQTCEAATPKTALTLIYSVEVFLSKYFVCIHLLGGCGIIRVFSRRRWGV